MKSKFRRIDRDNAKWVRERDPLRKRLNLLAAQRGTHIEAAFFEKIGEAQNIIANSESFVEAQQAVNELEANFLRGHYGVSFVALKSPFPGLKVRVEPAKATRPLIEFAKDYGAKISAERAAVAVTRFQEKHPGIADAFNEPIQVVGCYSMHLYCRNRKFHREIGNVGFNEITGRSEAACKKTARAAGWVFHKDRTVTCKMCRAAHPSCGRIKGRKK